MKRPVVLALLLLLACGGPPESPERPKSGRIASTATIAILEPQPGAELPGPEVTVRLQLSGGKILPQASTQLKPDEGHVHLKLDGKVVTLLGGLEETVSVSPGLHLLEVEFVAADHGPFNPRVLQTVTFKVS